MRTPVAMQSAPKTLPPVVYLHWNEPLRSAMSDCHTLLRESSQRPTQCCELVAGWPDFIRVINASRYGLFEYKLMVFCLQWPPEITTNVVSKSYLMRKLTNSDLELTGLVLLWLMMEHVYGQITKNGLPYLATIAPPWAGYNAWHHRPVWSRSN